MKLGQDLCLDEISNDSEHGSCRSKTGSLGHILEKRCVLSRGHIFGQIIMKPGRNVCLDQVSAEFEIGSCLVKN